MLNLALTKKNIGVLVFIRTHIKFNQISTKLIIPFNNCFKGRDSLYFCENARPTPKIGQITQLFYTIKNFHKSNVWESSLK